MQTDQCASDDALMEQAALWLLQLESEDCTAATQQACLQWRQENPKHEQVFQQMRQSLGQLHQLRQQHSQMIPHTIIEDAIQQSQTDQRFKRLHLLSIAAVFCGFGVLWQCLPINYWLADTRSDYQNWSQQQLPDHSDIQISGKSAYNIQFNQQQRVVDLIDGNILVDVAKDAQRPFIIQTRFAHIKALGTRFIVQQHAHATILTMLESTTEVTTTTPSGLQLQQKIHAGEQVIIDHQGIHPVQHISVELAHTAWQKHMLMVDLMPLDQVLAILQSYDAARFKYDPDQLKSIKVTAMLPLNGSALELLQQSLDIQVEQDFLKRKHIYRKAAR
ncbi:hypothetical protein BFG52_09390 [Acinetobacter larvae]|uniref:FecR protein domain-containing protein n=2 Tax=Acinetobacter larvae TaxID=1789224 RepID=A0A1B2M023_9GAMM|nr:hypothetical protein BFG52_09390 [Acinetobacter larvae]